MTNDEVIARLDAYARRLYQSVIDLTALHAAFRSLNDSDEWRKTLIGPVAHAANIIQHAMLREIIIILVRVLDRPRKLETSDKVSFAVIGLWLERAEIRDALVVAARVRLGDKWADRYERLTLEAIQKMRERIVRLGSEDPNREQLLRNYRDEFLAHELHLEIPRDQPFFGHIAEMTEEIQALCLDAVVACTGFELSFDHIADEAKEGADQLWRAVANRPEG